ncbi:MAG TPA: hypothetical protein VIM25_00280 [Candidatus Limnocylindrales bacterium]
MSIITAPDATQIWPARREPSARCKPFASRVSRSWSGCFEPPDNTIAITAGVHDMAGAQAMLASTPPEVAAAMERQGVIPPIAAYIEK